MKCVVQRVRSASVYVGGSVVGAIDTGLLVLVGITHADTEQTADWIAEKILALRIFPDADGKMNLSVSDIGGGVLLVSQFTLYADVRKGTRPSFIDAARPEHAEPLFNYLFNRLNTITLTRQHGNTITSQHVNKLEKGVFGAMMDVALVNDGPVTITIDH